MKERQTSARQLDCGGTRSGSRAGISPRAGSHSPTRVEVQSCEVVRNDAQREASGLAEGYSDESGFVRVDKTMYMVLRVW